MNVLHKALLSAAAFGVGAVLASQGIASAAEPVPARPIAEKTPKPAAAQIARPAKQATSSAARPDLTVVAGSIVATPATPLAGTSEMGDTRLQAEVRNLGSAEARNFTVAFMLKRGTETVKDLGRATVASLAPGAATTVSRSVNASHLSPAGNYDLKVMVDLYPSSVAESNEDNNTAQMSLTIIGPDFAVSGPDIEISPASPRPGETITVRAPIRNNGTGRGLLFARLTLSDSAGRTLGEQSQWMEVRAGGFAYIGKEFTLPAGYGDYAVRVEADVPARNPEPNEGDNRGDKYFSVRSR